MPGKTVLHLIDTGGPGGAETVFADLVEGLSRRGWRSVVAVPVLDWLAETLAARGVEPLFVPSRGSFDRRYLARLWSLARTHRVDLIQTHLLSTSVYASLAARALGIPVVSTFHGTVDLSDDESFRGAKLRILDRRANRFVFVSQSLREYFLARTPLSPARSHVVYNGIDPQAFRPERDRSLREELGVRDNEILIGSVGNIRPAKAYPVLLRAAALLRDRVPTCRFVVVGQGQGEPMRALLELRRALGLDERVSFLGFREDIPCLMRNFDIYLISSSAEGFSLSTVQALASGLPVVATRCGGPEEILEEGEAGILVDPGSPEAIASALQSLIEDAPRRRRLASAARARVEQRFTLDAMVAGYESVYRSCLPVVPHLAATGHPSVTEELAR